MPIQKEGGRRPPSKVQDMHPTTKLSKNTRLAPIDKLETNTEYKTKPHAYSKKRVAPNDQTFKEYKTCPN